MFDKLKAYLSEWTSPEQMDVYMSALEILNSYGLVSAWAEISVMLESNTDQDVTSLLDGLRQILTVGLDHVLMAHTVQVEGDLAIKTKVLEALRSLSDWDDSASIMAMIDADDDTTQTFCDLMELVTDKSWSEYAEVVTAVQPSLINRLADIHRERDDESDADLFPDIDPAKVEVVRRFVQKNPNSLAARAVMVDMVRVGTSFNILVNSYQEEIMRLEPMAPKQAALELVGLSVVSDFPMNDIIRQTKDQIDNVYSDLNFITQVDIDMGEVFNEVLSNG